MSTTTALTQSPRDAAQAPSIPRPACTVMLVRDQPQGMEVLLLKRSAQSSVHGGAFVFPGGKVDEADHAEAATRDATETATLHKRFCDPAIAPAYAAALYLAGVREVMEECGVALRPLEMHPHSRWITPTVSTFGKRFDTWFFLARLPTGAVARHDEHEAVDSVWLRPREALVRCRDAAVSLAPPQILSLFELSRHRVVADALHIVSGRRPPVVQPENIRLEPRRVVALPGDPGHTVKTRAVPGPLRFDVIDGRFEPAAGWEALLEPDASSGGCDPSPTLS